MVRESTRVGSICGLAALCVANASWLPRPMHAQDTSQSALSQAILVGGGPDIESNPVALEGNIRYLNRLLPPRTPRTILFADGNANTQSVVYDVESDSADRARRLWKIIFDAKRPDPDSWIAARAPKLGRRSNGASNEKNLARAFGEVRSAAPLLAFFTGHGGQNERDKNDNYYNLWGDEELSVREMAAHIARLPTRTPVSLVMVQCYSGAFGNVIFQNGDPKKPLVERDIAGFFAATNDRMAAGCTSEVDEAEYHDFTSYFFAALCGRDRVGRRVSNVDFNRDGRVGGDEAFAYTLAHDRSIDVPTCTSDVFLRRFAAVSITQTSSTRWTTLRSWASPSQRYALDKLSDELKLNGENRLSQVRQQLLNGVTPSLLEEIRSSFTQGASEGRAQLRYENARTATRKRVLERWPALSNASSRAKLKASVIKVWQQEIETGNWSEMLAADEDVTQVQRAQAALEESGEIAQAHRLRFARLCESVILRHNLQKSTNTRLKTRLSRLLLAEGRSILPPVAQFSVTN